MKKVILFIPLFVFAACSSNTSQTENTDNNQISESVVSNDVPDDQFDFMLGVYEIDKEDAENCDMKLSIEKEDEKYQYHLTTSKRDLKGNLIIKEDDNNDIWVILPDIQWDDYQGNVTGDEDPEANVELSEPIPSTLDVEFTFDKENNSLNAQNQGNAMNYFVIFGECDIKYISLIKK